MEDHKIERAAIQLIQKYGRKALPKAVEVIKHYVASNDETSANRWIAIGYAIRRAQNKYGIKEALEISELDMLEEA